MQSKAQVLMSTSAKPKMDLPRDLGPSALLEAIIHSSEDAIITKNLDGIITSWNPAAQRIFGYAPEEIVGGSVLRLIPEYLKYEEPEILRKLRAGEQIDHYETRRLTKDRGEIVVSLTISPILNEAGQVVGASKIARDITAQKLADIARFRLAAIVESADDAIVSKDLNGTVTSWNQAAERIFGYTEQEMIGRSILTLIPPELHHEEAMIIDKIRHGERVEHYESTRVAKSGKKLDVSLTISPLRDANGIVIGASKIARDVSERKLLEEKVVQAEKLAASGKMAATIAHEINNPLEAVLNLVYLAKLNTLDSETRTFLSAAEGELERLAHIAKQTLGFYREQNAAASVSLPQLVRDALRIYESKLSGANIEIRTMFEACPEIVVRRGELLQVISNLITNAAYAMPSGGRLSFRLESDPHAGRAGLCLRIEDTGIGIPAENLGRVFEPFFTTRNSIGTGIGLWVARQFIEGHGGTIDVQSSTRPEDHGTRFNIWLPLETLYSHQASTDRAERIQ